MTNVHYVGTLSPSHPLILKAQSEINALHLDILDIKAATRALYERRKKLWEELITAGFTGREIASIFGVITFNVTRKYTRKHDKPCVYYVISSKGASSAPAHYLNFTCIFHPSVTAVSVVETPDGFEITPSKTGRPLHGVTVKRLRLLQKEKFHHERARIKLTNFSYKEGTLYVSRLKSETNLA